MVQTKRKTNVIALALVLSLVLVFGVVAAIFAAPATETAYAATQVIDSLSLANINAGNAEGKYGNFSWDNTKIKSISASEMLTDRNKDPLCIVWTRPTNGAYASALTFSVNVTDSVGAITIRYDDPSVPSYVSPGEKQSGTLTETVNSLYSTYEKIYFYISCSYMYNDVHLTSVSIQIKATTYKMTFTKGTGIKDAYLSTNSTATSGSASGTEFAKFSTVYCFAKLAAGYKAQNAWTLIDGTANSEDAIYRVGTISNVSAAGNFGTINATAKTKSLTRNTNGGGYMSGITLTYGQTANLTVPTRNGYNFLGWNTKADGTGTTYGNASAAELTAEQVNAIIADSSISTVYAMWRIGKDTVIGFINDIPDPVVYTQACKDAIDTARGGYKDLSADDKALVTNYDKLTEAEGIYAGMQSDKEALDAYKITKKADADSLANPGDSDACGTLITNAKQAIDDIVYDCTKTLAENKEMVDDIIYALESDLYNQRQADGVAEYIDAISVPVTLASKPDINTARALYDGLSDKQKSLVSNYDKLTDAEAAYADVLANCEATIGNGYYLTLADAYEAMGEGATITINKDYSISGRGTPYINVTKDMTIDLDGHTLTIGNGVIWVTEGAVLSVVNSKPATGGIIGGCGADPSTDSYILLYDCRLALNAETVKQYSIINRIAKGYLVEDINGGEADVNGYYSIVRPITTADVIAAIEAIDDPVVYTDDCKAKIDEARALYDNMDEEDQEDVTNYGTLTDAESIYAGMDADAQAFAAYKDTAKGIADDMEEENDSVVCKQFVADAKGAIDALDYDCTKSLAENKALVDAILSALNIALNDQRSAEAVEELIDAISNPVTLNDKEAIETAREAFDALTEDQQDIVGNVDKLIAAEVEYVKLLIGAIGTVEYTEDSKEKIDAAREAFDALTDDQKALIPEDLKNALEDAEAAYQALEDNAKVAEVIALIDAIGEVEYTEESKAKIDAAREAFGALTPSQILIFETFENSDLPVAESTYAALADQAKAKAVKELIASIGEVKYPDSKEAISSARAAYDDLTLPQKELVDNYDLLEKAERDFAEFEEEANKGLSGGAIAGIVIGCVLGLCIVCFIVLFLLYKRDQGKDDDKKLIKVAFVNDVMKKTDELLQKLFKKKENAEGAKGEEPSDAEPKEDK